MKEGHPNRLISRIKSRRSSKSKKENKTKAGEQSLKEQEPLFTSLMDNETKLRSIYTDCSDLVYRSFYIGKKDKAITHNYIQIPHTTNQNG